VVEINASAATAGMAAAVQIHSLDRILLLKLFDMAYLLPSVKVGSPNLLK
jgi:hypothetical protein